MKSSSVWSAIDLANFDGPILLDTHIWIWHLEGNSSSVAPSVTALLDRSGKKSRIFVSDISFWEVGVKVAKGRLTLSFEPALWLKRAEKAPGIRFLPLDREALLLSTRLPGAIHNDPADRMLMAAAKLNNLPLVTADGLIVKYAMSHPGVPVVDARAKRGAAASGS